MRTRALVEATGRALLRLLVCLVVLATFLLSCVLGLVIHLDTTAAKRIIRQRVSALVSASIRGRLTIESIESISWGEIRGVVATATHPSGLEVVAAHRVDGRFDPVALLSNLLEHRIVVVDHAELSGAEVDLAGDGWEALAIAETFEAAEPSTPSATSIGVVLEHVVLRDVAVSGDARTLPFDAHVHDLVGSLHAGDDVTIDVSRADIVTRGAPRGAELDGTATVDIAVTDDDVDIAGRYEGTVGPAPVVLSASWRDTIEGRLDVGPVDGDDLAQLFPQLALRDDVRLTVGASGPPNDVALTLDVAAGAAGALAFDGSGRVEPAPDAPELAGRLGFRGIDLASIARGAPRTTLTGRGRVRLDTDGPVRIVANLSTEAGHVGAHLLPALELTGRYADGRARLEIAANGPRAALVATATADLQGALVVEGSADIDHLDLALLPLPDTPVSGTLAGTLEGTLAFADAGPSVDARASLTIRRARLAGVEAATMHVTGTARGPLSPALRIDARVRGQGLRASGWRFDDATASARGRLSSLSTNLSLRGGNKGVTRVDAESIVRIAGDAIVLDSPHVELTRYGQRLTATATRATVTPRVDVEGLTVDGPGLDARANIATRSGGRWSVEVRSEDLDLARVASLVGLDVPLEGRASLEADLLLGPNTLVGELVATWRDVTAFGHRGIAGRLDLEARGRSLSLELEGSGGPVRTFALDTDLRLSGSPLDLRSYPRATGTLRLSADADLDRVVDVLTAHVPLPGIPRIDGVVALDLRIDRDRADAAPSVAVDLDLDDAVIQPRGQFARALDGAFWPRGVTVAGVNVGIEASIDAATELIDLELRVHDDEGELIAFDGDLEVPWLTTWRQLAVGRSPELPTDWWRRAPARFWGRVPRRRLQAVPGFDVMGVGSGDVRLVVSGRGTVDDPEADLVLRSFGIAASSVPVDHPIDLVVVGHLDGERADARIKLFAPTQQMAVSHVRFRGSATRALLDGADDWQLDAHAQLCDLPLKTLAPLQEFLLTGRANGEIRIAGINTERPSVDVDLRVDDFGVGEARYRGVSVKGTSDAEATVIDARIAQQDGRLELHADLPLAWHGVLPTRVSGRKAEVELVAERFDVRALQPFLEGSVEELSGRLDGKLEGELATRPALDGRLTWSDGRLQLTTVNTRLSNIHAEVESRRDGRLVLQSLSARSMDGSLEARGYARLDGLALREAQLWVTIPEDQPIPVVVEGQSYGRASLAANASLRPHRDGYRADVNVSRVHVALPTSLGSSAVALAPADFIRFGTRRDDSFAPLLLSPPEEDGSDGNVVPWLVDIQLEDVELERQDLSVYLTGHPRIELADEVRMGGEIHITGGRLDVQGRTFDIQEGTIDFDNRPPDDPIVNVTASWQGPEGTTIYAKYIGPVSTGEVQLTSDPARPKSELLALLLFGDANHQIAGGDGGGATGQAVGLGGSVLAKGLNAALDDLIDLDLAARVDTTSSSNPEAELQWRVARQFSLAISHVLGIPEPGESPDRNYAGIEWRFAHEWSLETTVGDHGSTSVDVLWQHSY